MTEASDGPVPVWLTLNAVELRGHLDTKNKFELLTMKHEAFATLERIRQKLIIDPKRSDLRHASSVVRERIDILSGYTITRRLNENMRKAEEKADVRAAVKLASKTANIHRSDEEKRNRDQAIRCARQLAAGGDALGAVTELLKIYVLKDEGVR